MSKILVSIIIPTYNRASLIEETLQSILNQTITNWECIIVDDGSIDNTKQIIKDYELQDSRFKYFKRPKNSPKGANSCRNFGFKKSKGKYVNWFDSDDIMHSKKLELQVKQLEKDESVPFTVCQTYLFKESIKNTLGLRKEKIYSKNFFEDFITNKIKWLTQAPLIRKDFLIKNNLFFDENLQRSQEREFFIRVLNLVENYNVDNTPLVYFRIHENSISFGKINEDKLKSSFIVNYNILKNYKNRISLTGNKI
jgi:glycosyltransferase involved in cell wall biosynthesis